MNKATSSILAAAASVFLIATAGAQSKYTTPYTFSTLAGSAPAVTSQDGTGSAARFYFPSCAAVDAGGNVYIADTDNSTIRKVTPAGVVTTIAGTPGVPGHVDGTGQAAQFLLPAGVAVDSSGNVYVADTGNATIRKVTPAGVVTTLAGSYGVFGSTDATGYLAKFHGPTGIAVDGSGNLYVVDTINDTIRMVTQAGVVTTLAGTPTVAGSADGTGAAARFNAPFAIAVDGSGNLFVSDQGNNTIRKIASGGVVTTLAGTAGTKGSADGSGGAAQFYNPAGVAVDGNDNVYVADNANDTIRKITAAGAVTTLAGSAGTAGSADGSGGSAQFNGPVGIASDSNGDLYVSDQGNEEVRTVSPSGATATLAGYHYVLAGADGTGGNARFFRPDCSVVDSSGNVFVADTGEHTIRKITPGGAVTTIAGTAGIPGFADGTGAAARFRQPAGITVDGSDNVYVADTGNDTIRKITPAGVVTTIIGTAGVPGSSDGTGAAASFNSPTGIVIDGSGNLFVADTVNCSIRKITSGGVVTTVAGTVGVPGQLNGTGAVARFSYPSGLAIDGSGNIYVADTTNFTVRKMTSAGVVTTLAGNPLSRGTADGTGAAALFYQPTGVAVDSSGNVYVTDTGNSTIRKITSGGVVTTISGVPLIEGSANGTGTAAEFFLPAGIAADSGGNLYVSDTYNNVIRKITPSVVVTTFAGTVGGGSADGTGSSAQFNGPAGVAVDGSGNLYVADQLNQTIRKISPSGAVTTLAGTAGDIGLNDGTGGAAQFYRPFGVCVDQGGTVYVADSGNHTVRKITPGGVVTTLAGTPGHAGLTNGTGSGASLNVPVGIAVDNNGNLYVSEQGNFDIRKITSGGVVTTLAGTAGAVGSVDGTGGAAQFNLPAGLAVDGNGNVFVADYGNDMIRKITPAGVVTTFAGSPQLTGGTDATGSAARFYLPAGIAVDGSGNLYVVEQFNNTVRMITPAGVVSTLAGLTGVPGSADGTGPAARFYTPTGVAVDTSGNVYVADEANNLIRKGTLNGSPQISAQPTDQYTTVGGSATFSVTASGSGTLTYQWAFGGSAISGATGSSYTVTNAQASNSGAYTVTVTNGNGSVTGSANLYVNTGSSGARLINIATRALVGTGGNILIPGFVIGGSGTETLLIRADGPSLTAFGVPGALAAPSLILTSQATGATLATNTGWGTNSNPAQIASVAAQVGAFALASGSADCAVIVTLQPGAYTVQVSGVGNTTGVALAEVYEVAYTGTARLVNIATRAMVGTGGNILIPGFVIGGTGVEELLVRGDGPALTAFGVSGALAQPSLIVTSQATGATIGSNTVWGTNSNPSQISGIAASVGAFAFVSGSADSALIVNLQPGAYTMQISGVGGTTGVGLAEVYEVP